MVDALPGDVGDVQEAVDAAEIDEGAVVGDVLHHAVEDHAFLEALDQLGALFGAGFLEHRAAGDDDVAAGAVHLEDLERLRRAHQRAHVADGADVDLRAGQEGHRAAEIDGEAALDAAVDGAVDPLAAFEGALEAGPGFFAAGLFARQDDEAFAVLVALDIKLDDVAGLDFGLHARSGELLERHAAFALEADIDDGELVGEADDLAADDGAGEAGVAAEGLVEEGGEVFAVEMIECFCGGGCHVAVRVLLGAAGPAVRVCAPAWGRHGWPGARWGGGRVG